MQPSTASQDVTKNYNPRQPPRGAARPESRRSHAPLRGVTGRQNDRYDGATRCLDTVAHRKVGDLSPTKRERAHIKGLDCLSDSTTTSSNVCSMYSSLLSCVDCVNYSLSSAKQVNRLGGCRVGLLFDASHGIGRSVCGVDRTGERSRGIESTSPGVI